MNPGAILIGIAILAIAVPYVMDPLVNERKKQTVKAASLKMDGKDQQKQALAAIRDLDFDFQIGKVNQEDYETLRGRLVLEAAEVLQMRRQEDEKLEAMIRARLQQVKPSVECEKCGGGIRPQDLFCPACGVPVKNQAGSEEPAAQVTCPSCGKGVKEGDFFCTGCGRRLNGQPAAGNALAEN